MFTGYRALWFGGGFTAPLDSFDDKIAAAAAQADRVSWAEPVEEFSQVLLATISLFRHMPEEAWLTTGVANGNPGPAPGAGVSDRGTHSSPHWSAVRALPRLSQRFSNT